MRKKLITTISVMLMILASAVNVFADTVNDTKESIQESDFSVLDGDMSIEEGASPYIPAEDKKLNEEKLEAMEAWLSSRISGPTYMDLSVPICKQINGYYCGPATVQQTIKFYKGSAPEQTTLAAQLGTTTAGTDMTKISGVLNANLGYNQYSMITIGTESDWTNKITYALSINKPVVIDIKASPALGWLYRTEGHFLNVSGYNRGVSPSQVKVTDPNANCLGEYWYPASTVYAVNNAHFRRAMIW